MSLQFNNIKSSRTLRRSGVLSDQEQQSSTCNEDCLETRVTPPNIQRQPRTHLKRHTYPRYEPLLTVGARTHKCKRCMQASNFHTRAHNHSVFHADNDTPLSSPKHLLIMMGNCRLPQSSRCARGPRRTTGLHVFTPARRQVGALRRSQNGAKFQQATLDEFF